MAQFFGIVKVYGGNEYSTNIDINLVQKTKFIAAKATPQVIKFLINQNIRIDQKTQFKVSDNRFFVVGQVIPVKESVSLLVTGVYSPNKRVKKDSLSVQLSGILVEFTQSLNYQDEQNGFLLEILHEQHRFYVFLQSKDINMQKYLQILQGERVAVSCKIQANHVFECLHTLTTNYIQLNDAAKVTHKSPVACATQKEKQYQTTKTPKSTEAISKKEVIPGAYEQFKPYDLKAFLG